MALRVSELVGLQVSDVSSDRRFFNSDNNDDGMVKSYVTIRAETAKNKKERTIRIGDDILGKLRRN